MKIMIRTIAIVIMLLTTGLFTDGVFNGGILIKEAEARVGRPLTPGSVAGASRRVARPTAVRTTRRVIRRTTVYVATLPVGCTTVEIEGKELQQCGGTYYLDHGEKYVVVEVE
jgi:hypothetical protein